MEVDGGLLPKRQVLLCDADRDGAGMAGLRSRPVVRRDRRCACREGTPPFVADEAIRPDRNLGPPGDVPPKQFKRLRPLGVGLGQSQCGAAQQELRDPNALHLAISIAKSVVWEIHETGLLPPKPKRSSLCPRHD
jgi:hypothetical protein